MHAAVEQLSADGYPEAVLWVLEDNPRARRFYEREGWQAVADLPDNEFGMPLTEYRRELAMRRR
jgi:ribosomal protein S18 acetylase RimI-like enzyme